MSDKPTKLPGTFCLFSDSATKKCNITLDIPAQVITMTGYRIEMDDAATALARRVLYLDIPGVFNSSKMIDNNQGFVYLPLLLDSAAVTLQQSLDIPIALTNHIPDTFTMRILDGTFNPVSGLAHISLYFKVEYGHLN